MWIPLPTLKNSSTGCSHPLSLPSLVTELHRHEFLQLVNMHRLHCQSPCLLGFLQTWMMLAWRTCSGGCSFCPSCPLHSTELVAGAGCIQTAEGFRCLWAMSSCALSAGSQAGEFLLLTSKIRWDLTHFNPYYCQFLSPQVCLWTSVMGHNSAASQPCTVSLWCLDSAALQTTVPLAGLRDCMSTQHVSPKDWLCA